MKSKRFFIVQRRDLLFLHVFSHLSCSEGNRAAGPGRGWIRRFHVTLVDLKRAPMGLNHRCIVDPTGFCDLQLG